MDLSVIFSSIAAFLTTVSFLPQAFKVICTRETAGLSLTMYAMFTTGVFFWLLFGIVIEQWPIIIANVITFVLAAIILVMKIRLG